MKKNIFLLLYVFSIYGYSQEKKRLEINVSPLSEIASTPRIRLGLSYQPNEKQVIDLDFGYGNDKTSFVQFLELFELNKHYKFHEIRFSYKYFNNPGKGASFYFGSELFFMRRIISRENSYYFTDRTDDEFVTEYDFAKEVDQRFGFHVLLGFKFYISDRIVFDAYSGLGLRVKNVYFKDKLNARKNKNDDLEAITRDINGFFESRRRWEGFAVGPTLALNLKVGIVLFK